MYEGFCDYFMIPNVRNVNITHQRVDQNYRDQCYKTYLLRSQDYRAFLMLVVCHNKLECFK